MSFEDAYKEACRYVKYEKAKEISKIVDIGDSWIFFIDYGYVDYGGSPVQIEKESGLGYLFTLNDEDNRNRIREGKIIEVPK